MSSFDIAVITVELDHLLKDARIDNIYQINPKTLLLKIRRHDQPTVHLLIEAGKRIHLTSYSFTKPPKPPGFCMAIRKHLKNGKVTEVRQYDFERIIIIGVRRNGEYKLISELFGEGNIILVGPENEILQALVYRRMRDRNIIPKEKFVYPPSSGRNPINLKRNDMDQIRDFGQLSVVKSLTRFLSLGGLYAEEVLLRAGVDKNTSCEDLKKEEIDKIFNHLQELLLEIIEGKAKPCVFVDDQGGWIDAVPTLLKKYAHFECVTYENLNEALDEYYARTSTEERVEEVEKRSERELERLKTILRDQERALEDLKEKAELNRKIGDIIYTHLNELQFLLQRIMNEKRNGKSWEEIITKLQAEKKDVCSPAIYFDSLTPKSLTLQVSVEDQNFQLNLKQSIQENASKYYERAKRAEKKLVGVKKAIQKTQVKIEELKNRIIEESRKASMPPSIRPEREWYEKFRWFYSSDGFLVIGGKDASTNEVLIRKYMKPDDIVFHADILGAPFVLIETSGKTPPEQTIREAAQLAASYSRAWREMLTTTNVYWVSPQQVSKHPPSGQYLPKGSFMVYGKRNYVRNVLLEVAIGIKKEDGLRVIGGPLEAIARQTNLYVRIVPGRNTSSKLAKEIRHRLARASSNAEREEILKIPIEEVQNFIPLGRGDLLNISLRR